MQRSHLVTNGLDIDALARGPRLSAEDLPNRLIELRSLGATILECIKYVKLNQECGLAEAKVIVTNSKAWADQKDDFLRHQQEMFEELLAYNRDRIESIEQTMTPDKTVTVVRMKAPAEPD
jgi:hypothetical protein